VPTILVRTTACDFEVPLREGEFLLEGLRRANLPLMGFLYTDEAGQFVSLARRVGAGERLVAHSLRNPDFTHLSPTFDLYPSAQPVAEIISSDADRRCVVQFDRTTGFEYVYTSFVSILDSYLGTLTEPTTLQVALSGGGDGRVLGECIGRYTSEHPTVQFHAVITANGVEGETEHLTSACAIATRFGIPFSSYTEAQSAELLGFTTDLGSAFQRYRREFPDDEAEVVGTYWVQEVNRLTAAAAGRTAILYGFNQEDVIAERLFQALVGSTLPPYPVRHIQGVDLIAPLCKVPKKLIDALDVSNSQRNYAARQPSVSYLRSSLYFLAYTVIEQFPALAAAFIDGLEAPGSDEVPEFLDRLR
jgi:hypothetical protein